MAQLPRWTREQLRQLLAEGQELGHELWFEHKPPPADHPEGFHKFYAGCSCGWSSTRRATAASASQTGIHHLMGVVIKSDLRRSGELEKNGVSVAPIVRPAQ